MLLRRVGESNELLLEFERKETRGEKFAETGDSGGGDKGGVSVRRRTRRGEEEVDEDGWKCIV